MSTFDRFVFSRAGAAYIRRFLPLALIFLGAQFLVRLTLALRTGGGFVDGPADVIRPFLIGFWFDLLVLLVALVPGTLYWIFLPKTWRGGVCDAIVTYAGFAFMLFLIGLTMIGEHLFWTEFSSRFNFIAIDYLVYTQQVIGNIWESYPVGRLLGALIAAALVLMFLLRKIVRPQVDGVGFWPRAGIGCAVIAIAFVANDNSKSQWAESSSNIYANELSSNGYYEIVRAFFHNEIDYRRFYVVAGEKDVDSNMRGLVGAGRFVKSAAPDDITREVLYPGEAQFRNVVLVTIESLSASFMAHFGETRGLTPNLDRLADEGILFANMLATGTRTVRGLEAVTLSVPPTPGQSILRRPGNANMFSIGSVFHDHGYDVRYMYGGDGRFDNMNQFFGDNGYRVIDQRSLAPSEVTFSNAWGVCDEDLFMRAIKEADASHTAGTRFFTHVMTVSNHRPYTYPAGTITPPGAAASSTDLSQRTLGRYIEQTREAGVKYTDYAIGKFLEAARTRSWFEDTLFVFVADHTASSAGKIEVDPNGYHIPAIFYAPGFIAPRRIDRLVSQMDIAPSILGALNISYRSRFVGEDQINNAPPERALISNYEKVALVQGGKVIVLGPRRDVRQYEDGQIVDAAQLDRKMLFDATTYYQYASHWKRHFARVNSVLPGNE